MCEDKQTQNNQNNESRIRLRASNASSFPPWPYNCRFCCTQHRLGSSRRRVTTPEWRSAPTPIASSPNSPRRSSSRSTCFPPFCPLTLHATRRTRTTRSVSKFELTAAFSTQWRAAAKKSTRVRRDPTNAITRTQSARMTIPHFKIARCGAKGRARGETWMRSPPSR